MALSSLVTLLTDPSENRTKFTDYDGTASVLVDVTHNITPKYSVEVTQHPIETGSNVSDHIKVNNITVELDGYVSETPLTLDASARGLITSAAGAIGSKIGGSVAGAIGSAVGGIGASLLIKAQDPASVQRNALIGLLNSRKHFKLVAPSLSLDKDARFVMTSLTFPKDKTTGRGLKFNCSLQQIRFAESKVIDVSRFKNDVAKQASKQKDQGKKATQTEENGKRKSILKQVFGG